MEGRSRQEILSKLLTAWAGARSASDKPCSQSRDRTNLGDVRFLQLAAQVDRNLSQ